METKILALDAAGTPSDWLTVEKTAQLYATGKIAWAIGENEFVLRGGIQQISGLRSQIRASSIVAVRGREFMVRDFDQVPGLVPEMLKRRDRCVCAYCGERFREKDLTLEHILPVSRGGLTTWMNLVAACKPCNNRKRNRTPEEAKMPLLFVPYVPNRYEEFILRGRKILADQMEFLIRGVPKHSRLLAA